MYLVAIAWLYVALMMALAEGLHPNGTVLGAIVTFLFYGLLPTALVMYVMGTPLRRKARLRAEQLAEAPVTTESLVGAHNDDTPPPAKASDTSAIGQPNASSHSPGAAAARGVPPVGEPD